MRLSLLLSLPIAAHASSANAFVSAYIEESRAVDSIVTRADELENTTSLLQHSELGSIELYSVHGGIEANSTATEVGAATMMDVDAITMDGIDNIMNIKSAKSTKSPTASGKARKKHDDGGTLSPTYFSKSSKDSDEDDSVDADDEYSDDNSSKSGKAINEEKQRKKAEMKKQKEEEESKHESSQSAEPTMVDDAFDM